MGVDAMLFAVKAKKYCEVYRAYNLKPHGLFNTHGVRLAKMNNQNRLSFKEMEEILLENVKYYLAPDEDGHPEDTGRAVLNTAVLEFIKMFPDDEFIFATDHQQPDSHDIKEKGGYTEITFEELRDKAWVAIRLLNLMYDWTDEDDET